MRLETKLKVMLLLFPVAQVPLISSNNPAKSVIVDACCGTGLVGQVLAMPGAKAIDGLGLSPAMLTVANQTGEYRSQAPAYLTRRTEKAEETYEIMTCVGTLTPDYVLALTLFLENFVRITRRDGIVVTTILEEIWVSGGFEVEVERLKAENLVIVIFEGFIDYVKGHGDKGVLVVLEKFALA